MLCGASRPRPRARHANRAMMPTGLRRSGHGVLSVRVGFEAAQGAVPRLSQSAEQFFAALIRKKRFPADAAISVQCGWRRRNFGDVRFAANKRSAADVPANKPFRFQFRVGVGDRGAMYAQLHGQFARGRNAVSDAQISTVNQRAHLITQLYVERNVTFEL